MNILESIKARMKAKDDQWINESNIIELPRPFAASIDFIAFPKIARLNREIMITEKIDGTNAAIGVTDDGRVYAQSRNRIIVPGGDNYGFAAWVEHNQKILSLLGPGCHFGEWWGVGIGRGYDLHERRFSLFNAIRWGQKEEGVETINIIQKTLPSVGVIPVLYEGLWTILDSDLPLGLDIDSKSMEYNAFAPERVTAALRHTGSIAVPGYMNPEGIVIYHKASQAMFKITLEKDSEHKQAERARNVAA